MSWLWLPFACALPLALYGIFCTLYQHSARVAEVLDALFGEPLAVERQPDRWRTMHRAADRRAPFVVSDARPAAPVEQGKRA